jgi:hypothetical protein
MISKKNLLNIICTEALECGDSGSANRVEDPTVTDECLPAIQYGLELVEHEDGSLHWEE